MRTTTRLLSIVALIVGATVTGTSVSAGADTAGVLPAGVHFAAAPDNDSAPTAPSSASTPAMTDNSGSNDATDSPSAADGAVTPDATSPITTGGKCKYRQNVDNPHVTSNEASVHGWWTKSSGTCPSKATVTVYLQAYGCDDFNGCEWYTVAEGKRDVAPGTAKRANARLGCSDHHTVGWRGYVDVNLDGVQDPANHTYTAKVNLPCSP